MVTIDFGNGVTMEAPEGVQQNPGQGIDSIVGSFVGEGFECQYDHGLYSDQLNDMDGATVEQTVLSGIDARLVTAPPDFDGLHVPEVVKTVIGARRLTVTCRSASDETRQTVRTILTSLHVEPTD